MDSQVLQYIPVLLLLVVSVGFVLVALFGSVLVGWWGTRKRDLKRAKIRDTAYECGMLPVGDGSPRLSVKFYLVAILFVLFDIEVVFFYPWAAIYRDMLATNAALIFGAMVSFVGVLFVGYIYAWKKGAFEWKS